jgi:hypothetical protein
MVAHVQDNQFDLGITDFKENNVQTQIARAMFQVYEPIVLTGYGSPELQTICKQARADRASHELLCGTCRRVGAGGS